MTGLQLRCSIEDCVALTVTAASPGVTAGQMAKIEDTVGVYAADADTGAKVAFIIKADKILVPCAKAATAGYAVGEKVYFDSADGEVNESASGNTLCGVVTEASVVGDQLVEISLDGTLGITA